MAGTKKGWLPRDYRDNASGKTYGPGFAEVPADSTIVTFFREPPDGVKKAKKAAKATKSTGQ